MMGHVIDWTLTERVAGMLAGDPERGTPRPRLGEVAEKSDVVFSMVTDVAAHSAVVAARTETTLAELSRLPTA